MILLEYLRLVLLEGRLEDLKSKYPNIDIDKLWNGDPSKTKKYVSWMAKNLSDNSQIDELLALISVFDKQNSKFKVKDINSYKSIQVLKSAANDVLDSGPSKTKLRKEANAGALKIGENDKYTLYRIETHAAVMNLGRDTTWCITEEDGIEYETYVNGGFKFYFAICKHPAARRTSTSKIALAIPPNINSTAVFDSADDEITVQECSAIIGKDLVSIAKRDSKSSPKHIKLRVEKDI